MGRLKLAYFGYCVQIWLLGLFSNFVLNLYPFTPIFILFRFFNYIVKIKLNVKEKQEIIFKYSCSALFCAVCVPTGKTFYFAWKKNLKRTENYSSAAFCAGGQFF
jgi:hypothetical protein